MHLELPLKLLLLIVEYLDSKEDLNSFTRVSKYIRNKTNNILYKKHGELALLWAGEKGIVETAQLALRYYNFEEADANRKRELCERAFLLACDGGHIDLVKILLEEGVLATYKNYEGMSGLSLAAGKGHNDIVEMLVEAGAEPNCEDREDKSPLMLAAIGGHHHTVNILLDSGAAIDSLCYHESATALMFAAYHGHENIVNILLDRGANIDKTNIFGNTALWHAIWGCQKGVFQTLVQRGANTSLRDTAGKTYLERAEYYRGTDWKEEKTNVPSGYRREDIFGK
ncbi:ankyrin repeat-containing domain protein [Aspergillus pseudocaelatus]|uniref:Ankyrin repeat-containing domain protein n=1 Tax=Aspergillus pseudocaelatus TaxID=1825620 RepID=A0ABQ6VZZ4_9EURO|nr:ankyrin repeat-containing domain protein [Aspergillus pseudocaelatus]